MLFDIGGQSFEQLSPSHANDGSFAWINPYAIILLLCGSSLACGIVCCVADIGHSRTHNTVFWLKLIFLAYMSQLVYVGTFVFPTTTPHCRVWTLLSWILFELCRSSIQGVLCFRKPKLFLCFGMGSSSPSKTVRFAFMSCLFGTLISSILLICSFGQVKVVLFTSDMWQDFPLWRNDAVCATKLSLDFSEKIAFFTVLFWSDVLMALSVIVRTLRKCWNRSMAKYAMESVSLQSSVPQDINGYMWQFESDWWRGHPRFMGTGAFRNSSQDVTRQKPTTDLLTVRTLHAADTSPCALLWLVSLANLLLFVFFPKYTLHVLLCDSTVKICVSCLIIIRSFIQYTPPTWADGESPVFDVRSHYYSGHTSECGTTDFSDSDMIAHFGVGDRVGSVLGFDHEESTMYFPHEEEEEEDDHDRMAPSEKYESFFGSKMMDSDNRHPHLLRRSSSLASLGRPVLKRRTSDICSTDYPYSMPENYGYQDDDEEDDDFVLDCRLEEAAHHRAKNGNDLREWLASGKDFDSSDDCESGATIFVEKSF